jgi:hypothetical protein
MKGTMCVFSISLSLFVVMPPEPRRGEGDTLRPLPETDSLMRNITTTTTLSDLQELSKDIFGRDPGLVYSLDGVFMQHTFIW